ncbi:MAG: T9SS type A sorting domain-containing protein [Bacteroidales bacterium]|nr:T9SS type A sorting domain-containing protein [Bacteroidales bacterium]
MKSSSFPVILNSDSVVFVMDDHNVNQGYPIFGNEIYVVSEDATNITFNSATLNGTYSGNVDIKGFRYKETTDTVFNTVYCSLNAPYNYSISGLTEGTTYQYQYFVRKNGVSYYGDTKTFATISCDVSLNITMPTDAVCVGDDVVLIASAQSAYTSQFSFLWSTGDTGDTITPIENGTYLVTATADNACSQTASFSLSLYPSPHGTISGDTILCEGNTVTLTANGAWSYRWNTGTQGATISVSEPGTYSCLFTNEYGCSSEASVVVKYLSDFVISGNPNICIGESTVLSVPSVDSCIWNTGEHSFSINVTEAGNYRVTLYYGSCSSTISSNVILNPLPNVTIGGNTEVCEGSSAILVANGASTYHWSNGVTGSVNTVNTFGIYSVTGYSAQGCSNTASVTVMVYPLPVVNISGDTELCSGETTALTANGADTYLWNNGTNGAVLTTGLPGTYTVIATNAQGCSATASTYVTVNPLPNITISGNTAVCQGNTTTLVANGAATYQWNNGVSGAVNTIGTFGIYTVTGISAEGCSSTASATVVVYQLPVLNISGDTQLCSGETTTLTANGAATYLWNNGTTDAALTTGAAGTYTVIGTDEHGCYSTASIDVAVNYPSSTEVTVVECDSYEWQGITRTESGDYTWTGQTAAGCDSIITLHLTINESVTTEISETANNSYEWHGTTYTESGDYTWTGQTANGCDSTVTLHLTITTGVNEWSDGHFTVYPNPTTGMVNVRLDENGATWNVAEIQMFDVYGRLLNTVETCHGASLQTTQIDLSSYAPGIYLIKLVGDGRVIGVRKVVKR